jgi:hypothetical protein
VGNGVDRNAHMWSLNDKAFLGLDEGWNINFIHITEKHFQKDKLATAHINKLNTLTNKDKLRNSAQKNWITSYFNYHYMLHNQKHNNNITRFIIHNMILHSITRLTLFRFTQSVTWLQFCKVFCTMKHNHMNYPVWTIHDRNQIRNLMHTPKDATVMKVCKYLQMAIVN